MMSPRMFEEMPGLLGRMFSGLCLIGGPAPLCVEGGDGSEANGGLEFDSELISPVFGLG